MDLKDECPTSMVIIRLDQRSEGNSLLISYYGRRVDNRPWNGARRDFPLCGPSYRTPSSIQHPNENHGYELGSHSRHCYLGHTRSKF